MTTLKPEQLTAIIDTREQEPYDLAPMGAASGTLPTGDYSVQGLEDVLSLERKSLSDFVSCCGPGRERFTAELLRMRAYRYRAVVIEAHWSEIAAGSYRSKIAPASVMSSIAAWAGRYNVPFMLCGDRAAGEDFTKRFLLCAARNEYQRLAPLAQAISASRSA